MEHTVAERDTARAAATRRALWVAARRDEPIGERLRTLARLSGWPVMFAVANVFPETGSRVQYGPYNLVLALSLAFVVLTQLIWRVRLPWRGVDMLPALTDAATLFALSYFSGGVASPLRNVYFLFIFVNTIGFHIRSVVLIAVLLIMSWATLGVIHPAGDVGFESQLAPRQALFLMWTSLTAGLLAGILRSATDRANIAAQESAILFERASRSGGDLRSVLDSTVDGIIMVDMERRVRFVNKRMGELLGEDLSEVVGQPIATVAASCLAPKMKDPDRYMSVLSLLYGDMESEVVEEFEVARPEPRVLVMYSRPVRDEAGKLLGRIASYHDVTEERAADRLKDEFLSVAAHELKTPITSLKAYAQLLNRKPIELMSPHVVSNALTTIDRQATQLTLLVNDLLDVSRAEGGRLELHDESFDLARLAENTIRDIGAMEAQGRVEMLPSEPVMVRADPARIEQVVVNLLTNALKYSPDGGVVTVEVRREGGEAITRVTDQGIGIPAEKLPQVFDRFYQAHATTRYSHGGMGIGLYISKEIVTRHGGRIWVESEEGRGSSFYFSLPIHRGADA
jgi:PAS domain S-box-containing protein